MVEEHIAVQRFRQYLRIKTVQPDPDYKGCLSFLRQYAKEVGLEQATYEVVAGKPIFRMTWRGTERGLGSVLCLSHTDVVPVYKESWDNDPFAAVKLINGDIVARGSQDMKSIGICYVEAIRRLKTSGVRLARDVHVLFLPDEEIGSADGMRAWAKTDEFKELDGSVSIDEGMTDMEDGFTVYYGERVPIWFWLVAKGQAGHGSQFLPDTIGPKLINAARKLLDIRDAEEQRIRIKETRSGRRVTLGDVTTINLTRMRGGLQANIVPESGKIGFDMRVSPHVDLALMMERIRRIAAEHDCSIEVTQESEATSVTHLCPENVWWVQFERAAREMSITLRPEIMPGATDSRFVRPYRIPCFNISPFRRTPRLLHDHNEYLNETKFLEGLEFYVKLIERWGNVTREQEETARPFATV